MSRQLMMISEKSKSLELGETSRLLKEFIKLKSLGDSSLAATNRERLSKVSEETIERLSTIQAAIDEEISNWDHSLHSSNRRDSSGPKVEGPQEVTVGSTPQNDVSAISEKDEEEDEKERKQKKQKKQKKDEKDEKEKKEKKEKKDKKRKAEAFEKDTEAEADEKEAKKKRKKEKKK
jgi:hypothetical protein